MDEFGKVALALYFNFQDFPGASYGVFDGANQPRPAASMLKTLASTERRARIVSVSLPTLEPGALGDVVVTLENRGSDDRGATGSGSRARPVVPRPRTANAIAWEPAAGYANSIVDARVFLPHAVAPGDTVEIHVPVRAPAEPGDYTFAARMVHEGVELFGPTVSGNVTVTVGSRSDNGEDEAGARGGCWASGDTSWWLVLALGFLRGRRRTS